VLWIFDGVTPATLTPLPLNTAGGGGSIAAAAITPTATFIASQGGYTFSGTNSNGGSTSLVRAQPVRVERSLLPGALATMNLNALPFPTYTSIVSLGPVAAPTGYVSLPSTSSAVAISDDGSILYGSASQGDPRTPPTSTRAVRFDVSTTSSALIPLLNAGHISNGPAARGTSSDGSVMVGTSFGPAGADAGAFRYEHGTPGTVTPIDRLPGGTVNRAVAVSPDGDLTLVVGNSTHSVLPSNEMYLHRATTDAITRLGSPSTAWSVAGNPGMTADGSVVAASFAAPPTTCAPTPCTPPAPPRHAYFHNSRGWFRLESALAAEGVFLPNMGWTSIQINGINADGTLVFGQGIHNGNLEGFVAEFASDYLKNFDVPLVAPTDTSIVGGWFFPDPIDNNPTVMAFMADGTYFHIEANVTESDGANGFERGRYAWNPLTNAFTAETLVDTNGANGFSGVNGTSGLTLEISGDTATLTLPTGPGLCNPAVESCTFSGTRIAISPGSPVGLWYDGNPAAENSSNVLFLLDDGTYYFAQDGDSSPAGDPNGIDGIEKGTWTWDSGTGGFSSSTTVDTNREWGLNFQFPLPGSQSVLTWQLSPDQLRATVTDGTETFTPRRVAVASVATSTGANVVVEPTSGAGTTPVTIAFDNVSAAGVTTLETIDPTATGTPAPPAGFSLGDPPLYYELRTTASFTGTVSVCFNYAGISFGTGTPRLFHVEGGAWTDITSTIDTANTILCGVATSFSPFGIFVSPVKVAGFHSPVSQVPGAINTAKGGSTVPLKFNVYVNGVEKTDTAGLEFGVWKVGCTNSSQEDPLDFTTTGGTELRYSGGSFMQNWKTPKTPGCYLVRMTTTGYGLSLSALFTLR
jgi:hypothetical protein